MSEFHPLDSSVGTVRSGTSESAVSSSTIVLDSDAAVASFRESLVWFAPRKSDLHIEVHESYAGPEKAALQARLNELYSDCGCGTGTFAVLLTLVVLTVWWLAADARLDWLIGLRSIGVLIVAGIVGKGIGLVRTRVLLIRLVSRFESGGTVREGIS